MSLLRVQRASPSNADNMTEKEKELAFYASPDQQDHPKWSHKGGGGKNTDLLI